MKAGDNNDEGDDDGGGAFDFDEVGGEFLAAREFFADDNQESRNRINQAVGGVGDDSERARDYSYDNIEDC